MKKTVFIFFLLVTAAFAGQKAAVLDFIYQGSGENQFLKEFPGYLRELVEENGLEVIPEKDLRANGLLKPKTVAAPLVRRMQIYDPSKTTMVESLDIRSLYSAGETLGVDMVVSGYLVEGKKSTQNPMVMNKCYMIVAYPGDKTYFQQEIYMNEIKDELGVYSAAYQASQQMRDYSNPQMIMKQHTEKAVLGKTIKEILTKKAFKLVITDLVPGKPSMNFGGHAVITEASDEQAKEMSETIRGMMKEYLGDFLIINDEAQQPLEGLDTGNSMFGNKKNQSVIDGFAESVISVVLGGTVYVQEMNLGNSSFKSVNANILIFDKSGTMMGQSSMSVSDRQGQSAGSMKESTKKQIMSSIIQGMGQMRQR